MVFLIFFLEKVGFEKNQETTKSLKNYPVGKELLIFVCFLERVFPKHNFVMNALCLIVYNIHLLLIISMQLQSVGSISTGDQEDVGYKEDMGSIVMSSTSWACWNITQSSASRGVPHHVGPTSVEFCRHQILE